MGADDVASPGARLLLRLDIPHAPHGCQGLTAFLRTSLRPRLPPVPKQCAAPVSRRDGPQQRLTASVGHLSHGPMPPPHLGNAAVIRLIRARSREAADANGLPPLSTECIIVDERPPSAEAAVSRVRPRQKGQAVIQFDFGDISPPQCVNCEHASWPAHKSASGKWHCA